MNLSDSILSGKQHIHFIGIGGSGMYPLAQILHAQGYYLTGSDNNPTDTLEKVKAMGIPVFMGQRAENIKGADLIIHTAAIMADNPELIASKESGVPLLERADLLGILTTHFSDALCISGTHGKTTTSSMLTQILLDAGADPTAVIGGKLSSIGGSGRIGRSEHMVCESCEFCDHFLKLDPDVACILNIDEDHMEYFKTLDHLIASFHTFADNATRAVVYNGDDLNTQKAMKGIQKEKISFGFKDTNCYYPAEIQHLGGVHTRFTLMHCGTPVAPIDLWVPGQHNILNACAACACAIYAGVSPENLTKGMNNFHGAARRFEVRYSDQGITVADDYGHHPAEIGATLKAAKELDFKRIIAVHQPFTYSRTKRLMDDFADVLQLADVVVLSEIMGSREKNTEGVYTSQLAAKIPGCIWYPEFPEIAEYVASIAREGDLIITFGCGDVNKCNNMIVQKLKDQKSGL